MRKHQHLAVIDLVLQQDQRAVRVHHHGFACLAKFPPVMRAPVRLQPHLQESSSAASRWMGSGCIHASMFQPPTDPSQLPHRPDVPHQQPSLLRVNSAYSASLRYLFLFLSLRHAAIPMRRIKSSCSPRLSAPIVNASSNPSPSANFSASSCRSRSEEHTSELQSHSDLVCRLLLEKKK